jgi:hypothetical protein
MEETARKIGIAIVMIVPTFVVAGALWDTFHSWFAVLIWLIIMVGFAAGLVSGKLCSCNRGSNSTPAIRS